MRVVPSPPFLRRLVKGLPVTAKMMPVAKRKFGCLMGMLPPLFTKTITDWSLENIPDFHLGPGGREFRSHVTLKFGFVDSSPNTIEAVKEFLQGRPPLQVRLGGFDLFTSGYGKWKNEDGDVLFVEVDSPDLHSLNAELSAAFPCEDKYPEYKPHVTVAYLDPSVAESYRGLKAPFLNCSLILDTLEWSGADGVTEQFSLSILPSLGIKELYGQKDLDERKDKRGRRYCIDTDTGKHTRCPPKEDGSDEDTTEQEDSNERRKRNRARSNRTGKPSSEAGGSVAGENRRSTREGADRERDAGTEPAADSASQGVPVSLPVVNQRLNRFEKFFREKNQHEVADWMGMLRNHINAVGGEEALKTLGGQPQKGNDKTPVQYWGVATEEERWHHMGDFITDYLARNGISTVIEHSDPHTPLISAYGRPDKFIAEYGDFKPRIGSFANKLEESKHLPGLETSEDIGEIMGRPVTHLTDDVLAEMDRKYGKGQWIIKAYGDEAAAGYGIFFPQRAAAIKHDAQNTIWTAGERLARYGFELHRNKHGKVVGLKHHDGKFYRFGSDEYNGTIHGDARYWGDRAAVAADSEHGAVLPDGGKEFMAQPAFQAVGISDAERAAGKTWHEKNEGRVHLVVKNGKAEIIPHSTWLKGGNLPVVFEDDDTRAMAKAAQDTINALPEHARKGQVYAPDIMKTPDGYRVVELNPQGDAAGSGYLTDNHFTIDSYVSYLVGREPAHVQFIRKLLESRKASKKKTEKTMDTRSAKPSPPSLKSLPNYGSKGKGPCQQGERSDLTGCTSASGDGGKKPSGSSDEGKDPSQPQSRKQKLREKLRKVKERAKAIKDKIKEGGDRAISTAGKAIVITKNFFRDLSERILGKTATKTAEVVIEKVQDTVNQILLGEDYDIPDDPAGLGLDIALNLVPDTVAYLYRVAKVALGGKDPRDIKYPEKSLPEGIDLSEIADMIVELQEQYIQAGMDVVPMDRDGVLQLLEQNLAEPGAVGQKSLIYWDRNGGSYFGIKSNENNHFANCERDKQGHCLPSGEAGQKKPTERPKQTRKDKRQASKQKRQKARKRTKEQRQAIRNLAKGVSKIKDAVTSKMKKVNGKLQMTKAAAVEGVDKLIDWAQEKFDLDADDVKRMKNELHGYAKDRTDDFGKSGELPSPNKFSSILKTLRRFAPEVVGQITRRIKKATTGKDPREQAVDTTSTLRRILGPKLHAAVLGPLGGRAKPTAPTEEQTAKFRAALEKEWEKIQKEGKGKKYLLTFQKALSWLDSNNGGALVPPAQMGKKIPLGRPRKGKKLTPPSLKTFGWHKDDPDEKDSLNELKAFPLPTKPEEEDAHQIGQALEMALERYNKLRHSIGDNDVIGVRNAVNNPKWMLLEAAKDDVERLERHYAQARGKSVEQKALEIGRMLGGGHTFRRVDGFVKGFTGERPDKLGRRMCYRDGKRVPCPKKEGEIPKNPKPADENSGRVNEPDTTTPAEKEPMELRDGNEIRAAVAETEAELEQALRDLDEADPERTSYDVAERSVDELETRLMKLRKKEAEWDKAMAELNRSPREVLQDAVNLIPKSTTNDQRDMDEIISEVMYHDAVRQEEDRLGRELGDEEKDELKHQAEIDTLNRYNLHRTPRKFAAAMRDIMDKMTTNQKQRFGEVLSRMRDSAKRVEEEQAEESAATADGPMPADASTKGPPQTVDRAISIMRRMGDNISGDKEVADYFVGVPDTESDAEWRFAGGRFKLWKEFGKLRISAQDYTNDDEQKFAERVNAVLNGEATVDSLPEGGKYWKEKPAETPKKPAAKKPAVKPPSVRKRTPKKPALKPKKS